MGGEFKPTLVYGFQVRDTYVKLRGFKDLWIACKTKHSYPIYFCTDLSDFSEKEIMVVEIEKLISSLNEKEKRKMAEFDLFAEKYGYKASWQLCCVGDLEVNMASDTKEEVIERLYKLKNEFLETGEQMHNDDGSYTEDAEEGISIVLLEEYMGFMVDEALKKPNIDSIIEMVKNYYSME